jgi:subtilisin family serine protease
MLSLFFFISQVFANYVLIPKSILSVNSIDNLENELNIKRIVDISEFPVYTVSTENLKKFKNVLSHHFIIEKDGIYSINDINYVLVENDSTPWHKTELENGKKIRDCHQNNNLKIVNYLIDTGIDISHKELEGRAEFGKDFSGEDDNIDGVGHGTMCSGLILGKTYSVCKNAQKIVAVKVLGKDGSGSMSNVLKGIEWVLAQHVLDTKKSDKRVKSIINMSLGGAKSRIIDGIIKHVLLNKDITIVVAAGNENQDLERVSPASSPGVIPVMASTRENIRAFFSNFGGIFFAPGHQITSIVPNNKTSVMSGTSFSSPLMVSVVNHYIDMYPDLNRKQLSKMLQKKFKKNYIKESQDTPNYFPQIPEN